jgi:hypothetical protein
MSVVSVCQIRTLRSWPPAPAGDGGCDAWSLTLPRHPPCNGSSPSAWPGTVSPASLEHSTREACRARPLRTLAAIVIGAVTVGDSGRWQRSWPTRATRPAGLEPPVHGPRPAPVRCAAPSREGDALEHHRRVGDLQEPGPPEPGQPDRLRPRPGCQRRGRTAGRDHPDLPPGRPRPLPTLPTPTGLALGPWPARLSLPAWAQQR